MTANAAASLLSLWSSHAVETVTGWNHEQPCTPGQQHFEVMHAITAADWGYEPHARKDSSRLESDKGEGRGREGAMISEVSAWLLACGYVAACSCLLCSLPKGYSCCSCRVSKPPLFPPCCWELPCLSVWLTPNCKCHVESPDVLY